MGKPADPTRRPMGLGRGLSALLGEVGSDGSGGGGGAPGEVRRLPIGYLRPGRFQPRRRFDEKELRALVESIRRQGILQPLLVRPETESGPYEIIAGERRWRAAQAAGLHEAPVVVREVDDGTALQLALVENIQRQDLNPIEEAEAYRQLADEFGHSQADIAAAVGKSRSHIANLLRLLSLPEEALNMVRSGSLAPGAARAVLNDPDPGKLARKIVDEGLNVREAENIRRRRTATPPHGKGGAAGRASGGDASGDHAAPEKSADTKALEHRLFEATGIATDIHDNPDGSGALTLRYRSLDELDNLCRRLTGP